MKTSENNYFWSNSSNRAIQKDASNNRVAYDDVAYSFKKPDNSCTNQTPSFKRPSIKCIAGLFATLFLLVIASTFALNKTQNTEPFLRLHIRANSNLQADQAIKYEIKEAVVAYLTPALSECLSKNEAIKLLRKELPALQTLSNDVLKAKGFPYTTSAELKKEEFPDRAYDGITLPAGTYDSIIINLGTGTGDNWWCVVYPPLCFVNAGGSDAEGITYKSKFAEIIKKFTA